MTTEELIPKVRSLGPHHFTQKNWRGKPVGEKLKYRWKKRPYVHQVKAVRKLLSTGFGGALLMEPRTGKTKVVIDYMSIMHMAGKVNRVLVLSPISGLGVWEDELADNCPVNYNLLIWDKKSRKEDELPKYGKDRLDIVVMNYDALATPAGFKKDKYGVIQRDKYGKAKRMRRSGGRFAIKKKILRWQPQMIVLDESHRIKSPSAKKTYAVLSIKKGVPYRVLMTGTVVTKRKRIFDIYAQWKFLNEGRFSGMTFSDFKNHFGRWRHIETESRGWSKFLGPANETELHKLVHLDAYSVRRDECYDLPARTNQMLWVDLEESGEVYDQMAEDMVARIETGEITEATIKLTQGLRLRQITSGLAKTSPSREHPEGRLVVIGSEKLRILKGRLEDLLEADEKVVLGAFWRGDLVRIENLVKKMHTPIFVVKGGVKPSDREYARKQFPKVDGGAVFLGQPSAASEAIDLSCSSITIWYSLTNSWVNWKQYEDRTALSDRPTFFEYILARHTVDEMQYDVLQEDSSMGRMMITRPELLLRERGH